MKVIAFNKKANFEYYIIKKYEAGIELTGTEIKSIRKNKVNFQDAYASITSKNEIILQNMHISPYAYGTVNNHEPLRKRKILMHKKEIYRLRSVLAEQRLTLVPLKIYFKNKWVKIELGLCKGKKLHDKRATIKKREDERKIKSVLKRQ